MMPESPNEFPKGFHIETDESGDELITYKSYGGEGEDSFPSWGLNLMAGRRFRLLARQPIEKSDWLGQKLADFFGIEFKRCSSRK